MKVKVKVDCAYELPTYKTSGSAGVDFYASNEQVIKLMPNETKLIPTGLYVAVPDGYEIQIRPRSGLVFKHGVTVKTSPGTVDSDYRGHVMIMLYNTGDRPFYVYQGDRIAQGVLTKYEKIDWELVEELDETVRGGNGFGSTGIRDDSNAKSYYEK